MTHILRWRQIILSALCLIATTAAAVCEEESEVKKATDKASASRLRAVREFMGQIEMKSIMGDQIDLLELKPDPLIRYSDATRDIVDSLVFRVGKKGRPLALISAELYGRQGTTLLLNHEFVALFEPKLRMKRDAFVWEPREGTLVFKDFPASDPPAENPRTRLAQMRKLSEKFTASQMFGTSQIVLRRMSTPVDRYEPSDHARADGSIFAFAWGVNPEAALFIESDGKKWVYAWAPLSSAPLEAKLDDTVVWTRPLAVEHEDRAAAYTSIHRQTVVPDYFDDK
jgi:hypothetical protein